VEIFVKVRNNSRSPFAFAEGGVLRDGNQKMQRQRTNSVATPFGLHSGLRQSGKAFGRLFSWG
jgi:hypothetical protein